MSGILDLLQSGIYGIGDAAQRTYQGILNNPAVDRWRMGVGERMTGLLNNPAAFMRDAISEGIGFKANVPADLIQQVKYGDGQLTEQQKNNLLNLGLAGITVWHGSPHKFNKFDSSKIGTGEGAQAYGHGMYFAENPAVASEYRSKLSKSNVGSGGVVIDSSGNSPESIVAARLATSRQGFASLNTNGGKYDIDAEAVNHVAQQIDDSINAAIRSNDFDVYSRLMDQKAALGRIRDGGINFNDTGSLYKVDLPDELVPKMLDWDKPLSQQPESVRKAVEDGMRQYKWPQQKIDEIINTATGQQALNYLMPSGNRAQASEALKNVGIPGIRYLDGGSRGSGQGTYNYVVFPGMEDQLKILERQ